MPVQLKGSNGYYSREVEIGGSVFRIRELTDEELAQYGGSMEALQEQIEEVRGGEAGESTTAGLAVISDGWRVVDQVVGMGLVGWDLEGAVCTAANAALLPNFVKRALLAEIIGESGLTNAERATLGG